MLLSYRKLSTYRHQSQHICLRLDWQSVRAFPQLLQHLCWLDCRSTKDMLISFFLYFRVLSSEWQLGHGTWLTLEKFRGLWVIELDNCRGSKPWNGREAIHAPVVRTGSCDYLAEMMADGSRRKKSRFPFFLSNKQSFHSMSSSKQRKDLWDEFGFGINFKRLDWHGGNRIAVARGFIVIGQGQSFFGGGRHRMKINSSTFFSFDTVRNRKRYLPGLIAWSCTTKMSGNN